MITLRITCHRPAPSVYDTLISSAGTRAATSALIRVLKNTVPITSRAIFDGSPSPSQMISRGMKAGAGM